MGINREKNPFSSPHQPIFFYLLSLLNWLSLLNSMMRIEEKKREKKKKKKKKKKKEKKVTCSAILVKRGKEATRNQRIFSPRQTKNLVSTQFFGISRPPFNFGWERFSPLTPIQFWLGRKTCSSLIVKNHFIFLSGS